MKISKNSYLGLYAIIILLMTVVLLSIFHGEELLLRRELEKIMSLQNKGKVLLKKGMYDEAEKIYLESLHILPDCRDICVNLSKVYISKGDYDNAIAFLEKAAGMDHGEVIKICVSDLSMSTIYYFLGISYKNKREYKKALSAFHKVLELDSEIIPAYLFIGDIYKIQGKYNEAVESYQKVISYRVDIKQSYINMLIENLDYFKEGTEHHKAITAQLEERITSQDIAEYDDTIINKSSIRDYSVFLYHAHAQISKIISPK